MKKYVKVAGGVVIKEGQDKEMMALLIRRSPDDHWPHHYEFPRGKCDYAEKEGLIHCLKREVKEECGLDVTPVGLIDSFQYIADNGNRISTQYNYLCKMNDPNQEVKLSHEHSEFIWITSVGEVELMTSKELKITLTKVLNRDSQIVNYDIEPSVGKIKEDINMQSNNLIDQYLEEVYVEEGLTNVFSKYSESEIKSILSNLKSVKTIDSARRILSKIPYIEPDKIDSYFSKKIRNYSKLKKDSEKDLKDGLPSSIIGVCSSIITLASSLEKDQESARKKYVKKILEVVPDAKDAAVDITRLFIGILMIIVGGMFGLLVTGWLGYWTMMAIIILFSYFVGVALGKIGKPEKSGE